MASPRKGGECVCLAIFPRTNPSNVSEVGVGGKVGTERDCEIGRVVGIGGGCDRAYGGGVVEILPEDDKGSFREMIISSGVANHESKIADMDGDGDYDIPGKPYGWDTPRLDIWLQNGTGK
jgi:hypothetical protein